MKRIVTFALVAGGALALAACGGKKEEAPAAEPTADTEMMAPVETPAASETGAPAEDLDPTGNPIGPGASGPEAAGGTAATPAAE
jgi:hypothetical protein